MRNEMTMIPKSTISTATPWECDMRNAPTPSTTVQAYTMTTDLRTP